MGTEVGSTQTVRPRIAAMERGESIIACLFFTTTPFTNINVQALDQQDMLYPISLEVLGMTSPRNSIQSTHLEKGLELHVSNNSTSSNVNEHIPDCFCSLQEGLWTWPVPRY